jgi:hypothetical protein
LGCLGLGFTHYPLAWVMGLLAVAKSPSRPDPLTIMPGGCTLPLSAMPCTCNNLLWESHCICSFGAVASLIACSHIQVHKAPCKEEYCELQQQSQQLPFHGQNGSIIWSSTVPQPTQASHSALPRYRQSMSSRTGQGDRTPEHSGEACQVGPPLHDREPPTAAFRKTRSEHRAV